MFDTLEDRLEASFKKADSNKKSYPADENVCLKCGNPKPFCNCHGTIAKCPDCNEPVSACDHYYCKSCGNHFDADEVIND